MNLKDFAKTLPYPIKQSLKYICSAIAPRFRYGKVFWDTYNFLQESQWWSREKLEEYQVQQLSKLLRHAYENVSYYRRAFDERGLKPKSIQSIDDLRKLPYFTKNEFKAHFNEFIATSVNLKSVHVTHTSGTTGKPLQFYQDNVEAQKEWAFVCHQWSRVGYKPGKPRVELRGSVDSKNLIYYNPISKVLRLSPCIDSNKIAHYYLERIRSFGAKFLHGYPGAIASFVHIIKEHGLIVPFKLRAVLFASEAVYDWEREIIKEVFNCRVFDFYGQTEHVVIAAECENSRLYHCIPQYGITEINPDTHEIIGTGFLNYVNPFIRYRTTDIASQSIHLRCNECGRQYFPVFPGVEGRLEDFIIKPKGILVSPAVITHPFKDFETIKDTQIVQKSLDCIKLRVAPWDNYRPKVLEDELHQLCQGLQNILGPDMKVETEIVKAIQLSKSGKFKWIISEVSKDFLKKGVREV